MSVLIDYSSGAFAANKAQGVGTVTAGTGTYNLAVASYDSVSFSVAAQETLPQGLFFKPDGTKIYVIGQSSDTVFQYSLSTAWDISTASYDSVSFSVSAQDSTPQDVFLKPDGTKMYIVGDTGNDINEYNLSTAWDVSTASFVQNFSVSTQEAKPSGVFFKPDGYKMYVIGSSVGGKVYEYSLSTAWNISTASYSQTLDVSSQQSVATGLFFSADGYVLFTVGRSSDNVNEFSLSTAWDISTASHVRNFSVSSQETEPSDVFFKPDGSKMYVLGYANDTIYQYSTGTATSLDISSGTYFNYTPSANTTFTFSNAPASGTAAGFALAVTGANVGAGYDIANASYDSVSFSVASQDTSPFGITFKDDGSKFYVIGNANDTIYQYAVSTAWDVSTASFETGKTLSVANEDTSPGGVRFKSDGTSAYIVGLSSDNIYQYDLTTAWDISTGSYANKSLSVSTQESQPRALYFKDDGSKVYIIGSISDTVHQYTLSTAWDISTGSFETGKFFNVSAQASSPKGLFFSPSGDKMYVLQGFGGSTVFEYTLSTNWDVSTASYNSISFSFASQDTSAEGIDFKVDGSKMYAIGASNDTIYQYSTGSVATATFSYPASVEWPSGTAPDAPAIGETDVLVFLTDDGGTSYQGFQAGDAMS